MSKGTSDCYTPVIASWGFIGDCPRSRREEIHGLLNEHSPLLDNANFSGAKGAPEAICRV